MNNQKAIALTQSQQKIFYATQSEIFYLSLIPYKIQIKKCLEECRIDDALMIFNSNVPSY